MLSSSRTVWTVLGIGCVALAAIAAALIVGGDNGNVRPRVVYRVTDSASGTIDLTYENASGNNAWESGVETPWERRLSMDAGAFVQVSAQRGDGSGEIGCTITVHGEVVASAESSGAFVNVACDGIVPYKPHVPSNR